MGRVGAGLGQTLGFVWSAPSDEHPGQHGVQQEAGAAQRLCGETEPRPRPQTAGPQDQDEGMIPSQIGMCPNARHASLTDGARTLGPDSVHSAADDRDEGGQ